MYKAIQLNSSSLRGWLTVLVGCMLPLSTFMTSLVSFLLLVTTLCCKEGFQELMQSRENPVVRVVGFMVLLFTIFSLSSSAPFNDVIYILKKVIRLTFIPIFIVNCKLQIWRLRAFTGFSISILLTLFLGTLKLWGFTDLAFLKIFSITDTNMFVFKDSIITSILIVYSMFVMAHLIWNQKNYIKFLLSLFISAGFLFILFASVSRTGYAILFGLSLLFILQRFSFKQGLFCFICLCLSFVMAFQFSPLLNWRLKQVYQEYQVISQKIQETESDSIILRHEFLENSIEFFQLKPWFGHGVGSFKPLYRKLQQEKEITASSQPHNEYIHLLVQLGVVGFSIFAALYISLFYYARGLITFHRYLVEGLLIATGIGSLFNCWFLDYTMLAMTIYFLGLFFADYRGFSETIPVSHRFSTFLPIKS